MNGSYPNDSQTGQTLVIGSSGFIGRFITEACLDSGRPTYILVRSSSNSPSKVSTIKFLQDKGAIVIYVFYHFLLSTSSYLYILEFSSNFFVHVYIYVCVGKFMFYTTIPLHIHTCTLMYYIQVYARTENVITGFYHRPRIHGESSERI